MSPFELIVYAPAERDFRQLTRRNPDLARLLLEKAIPAIKDRPYVVGRPKKGPLASVYAFNLKHRNVAYRICYLVQPKARTVLILAFGVHDMAYRKAEGRLHSVPKP